MKDSLEAARLEGEKSIARWIAEKLKRKKKK